jgi:hypothetical protein
MASGGNGCSECLEGNYLHRNGNCYDKINGCKLQSGIICIECTIGYILIDNICK